MTISALLDLLFPAACLGCGRGRMALCAACSPSPDDALRFTCQNMPVAACGSYADTWRAAILALKRGRRDVGEQLGILLARELGHVPPGVVLVPVPTTPARRRERGFDQSELLASVAARERELRVARLLCRRTAHVQQGRSRAERLQATGRFRLAGASFGAVDAVVLVDDVITTGSTIRECAAMLAQSGRQVLGAVVLARADHPPD